MQSGSGGAGCSRQLSVPSHVRWTMLPTRAAADSQQETKLHLSGNYVMCRAKREASKFGRKEASPITFLHAEDRAKLTLQERTYPRPQVSLVV